MFFLILFRECVIESGGLNANAHGAVNLSQGFPDFDGPEAIRQKAAEALLRGPNQYVLSYGIAALREAVARKMKRSSRVM